MPTTDEVYETICGIITEFNTKGITLTKNTSFAVDLELDSLTVMDLVAAIEDEYDIIIPMNALPDLETIGQVAQAVSEIVNS